MLHGACEAGHPDIVRELIARGANPNATDLTGTAPFHVALRKHKSTVSNPDLIAMTGHLLTGGADAGLADPTGETALTLASTGPIADKGLVEAFVAAGKMPATELFVFEFVKSAQSQYKSVKVMGNARFDEDEARQSAASLAVSLPKNSVPLGNAKEVATAMSAKAVTDELARLIKLWQERADRIKDAVDAIKTKDLTKLQTALDADPRLAHIPLDANTNQMALAMAALNDNTAAVAELVNNRGVSVEQKSPKGRTALHEILSQEIKKTNLPAQQKATAQAKNLIITHAADVNATNRRGETALHLAGFRNNVSMINELAALKGSGNEPDPTIRDDRGWTALDTTLGATNREAEDALHGKGLGGKTPPLAGGKLSSIDILYQSTLCEDPADAHKVRIMLEKLYANADLRPMLDMAAAAACDDRDPPDGGLRLFASKTNTVGRLYGQTVGATAAYDEKVNTLLFPIKDGEEGEAVGSLAHELTHLTAHLVTGDQATLPFDSKVEKQVYLDAIEMDVRKLALLDDKDPVQKFIKNRFSGRMSDYSNKPGTKTPRTGAEFDEALLQEFIVGVPQVAAIYGMDELRKHMPSLTDYFENAWIPRVKNSLKKDDRFINGRAKIDDAANAKAATVLEGRPGRGLKTVESTWVKASDDRLKVDTILDRLETHFVGQKGKPKNTTGGARTVHYKIDDFELSRDDKRKFDNSKGKLRDALTAALTTDNLPKDCLLSDLPALVETMSAAVSKYSGRDLKRALNNRALNWVKQAKISIADDRLSRGNPIKPDLAAEVIVYRAEAQARGGIGADLDPDTDIKQRKQRDLINQIRESLGKKENKNKLDGDPAKFIQAMSDALAKKGHQAVYEKRRARNAHVSIDVRNSRRVWLQTLKSL